MFLPWLCLTPGNVSIKTNTVCVCQMFDIIQGRHVHFISAFQERDKTRLDEIGCEKTFTPTFMAGDDERLPSWLYSWLCRFETRRYCSGDVRRALWCIGREWGCFEMFSIELVDLNYSRGENHLDLSFDVFECFRVAMILSSLCNIGPVMRQMTWRSWLRNRSQLRNRS